MAEFRIISPDVLAEYRARGDQPEFWADHWRDTEYLNLLSRYERGRLDEYRSIFKKHLPLKGKIVEAGCGRGQYVAALRGLGYNIVGVDFASELVNAIRRAKPDMPVEVGDVRSLPYEDSSMAAYISLGVVEHFWEGPEAILAEAWRILEPGGLILASVPYLNPALRKRAKRDFTDTPTEESFYQFYFSNDAFLQRLRRAGFQPVETYFYGALYGAKRAYPRFNRLYDKSYPLRFGLKQIMRFGVPQSIESRIGHMQMVVARKSAKITMRAAEREGDEVVEERTGPIKNAVHRSLSWILDGIYTSRDMRRQMKSLRSSPGSGSSPQLPSRR